MQRLTACNRFTPAASRPLLPACQPSSTVPLRRRTPCRQLRTERRAVEDEAQTSTSDSSPKQSPGQSGNQGQSRGAEENERITTWKYGKTTSDKDLPALYLGLMIVPFIAMMALPFLPKF